MAENPYWKNVLTIVPLISSALATVIYLLRLFARRLGVSSGWQVEDVFMGLAVLVSYGATVFVVYTAFNGVGLAIQALPPDERRRVQFGSWMIQKFWASSMALIKISILVFLHRLLGVLTVYRVLTIGLMVFVTGWALAAFLVNTFQCWPVQYYYNKDLGGHCIGHQTAFFQTIGSLALVEDVVILCLPLPVVWRLEITKGQKSAVTLVFSLGGLVCIFSLLRLLEFRKFAVADLASSSSALESVWTVLEINVAIICGSLLQMKPVLHGLLACIPSDGVKRSYAPSNRHRISSTTRATPDEQKFMFDPRKLEHTAIVQGAAEEAQDPPEMRQGSEVELRGIAITTAVDQDVECWSDLATADEMPSSRNWPL